MPHAFFKLCSVYTVILSSSGLRPCLKSAKHYQNRQAKLICNRPFPTDSLYYVVQEGYNSDVKSNRRGGVAWKICSAGEHACTTEAQKIATSCRKTPQQWMWWLTVLHSLRNTLLQMHSWPPLHYAHPAPSPANTPEPGE